MLKYPGVSGVDEKLLIIRGSGIENEIDKLGLESFSPVLLNGYKRKYFLSADKVYRITIDTEQIFYGIGKTNNSSRTGGN